MSYLYLPKGIQDFKKAVISFWFKIPAPTIDTATNSDIAAPIMANTVPLLTFCRPQTEIFYQENFVNVVNNLDPTYTPSPTLQGTGFINVGEGPLDPCYIGIYCNPDPGFAPPILAFNFRMPGYARLMDWWKNCPRIDVYQRATLVPGFDPTLGSGWYDYGFPSGSAYAYPLVDTSPPINPTPEQFLVQSSRFLQLIAPDVWHHLLLSFDFSNPCYTRAGPQLKDGVFRKNKTTAQGTDSYCKLWYAFDDVNYSGPDNLGPYAVDGGDPNGILTANAWQLANTGTGMNFNRFDPVMVCQYDIDPVPANDAELGLPASAGYVDNVYHVEMAELQLFTDVTLDTGVEANRRAFIDFKRDAKGNPTLDSAGKMTLAPVDPTSGTKGDPRPPAERLLGKRPAVVLHGSSNWVNGNNTGSTGVDDKGNKIAAGQFKPVAGIKKYSGPSITK